MKKKQKKIAKSEFPRRWPLALTTCNKCRIRLVVKAEGATKCGLCDSPDIVKEPWVRK